MMKFIAEKILRKAIEEGSFDFSSKSGIPLNLEENPFQDPSHRLSFYILKNAGMKPPWLETEIEIRSLLEKAHEDLVMEAKTWDQKGENWDTAKNQFFRRVEDVNIIIRKLNLQVPLPKFQRIIIKPHEELEKILANPHVD